MAGITERVINAIRFADVGHHIEGKVQSPTPDVIDPDILQLRKYSDHFPSQYFCASSNRFGCLREECSPPAEDQAVIPQTEIVQIMHRVKDHPSIGDQLLYELFRQFSGGNNEGSNRDDFLL